MPESLNQWLAFEILGNSMRSYIKATVYFLGAAALLNIARKIVFVRLHKIFEATPSKLDDFFLDITNRRVIPVLFWSAFYLAFRQLKFAGIVDKWLFAAVVIVLTFCVTRLVLDLVVYFMKENWLNREAQKGRAAVSTSILTIVKVVLWGVAFVFALDNLGFNVSAVVAGLGIGGVAVALAAQSILTDLFNYFVIFFDRPFEEGDFIVVDDFSGTIENIGIKTTRIRGIDGEEIVAPNSLLTTSKIRNHKRMRERRIQFTVGIIYETPKEKVEKIPGLLRKLIEQNEVTRFDRAHFKTFGPYSLDFEVVYFVMDRDYNKFMDIQQKINFAIKEMFEREGIEFAYPTQVAYSRVSNLEARTE